MGIKLLFDVLCLFVSSALLIEIIVMTLFFHVKLSDQWLAIFAAFFGLVYSLLALHHKK